MRTQTAPLRRLRGPAGAVLVAGALGQVMTFPGQTAALSVFIDPIIRSVGVSRTVESTAYLCATLAGAAALPLVGRAIDRFGVRAVMTAIGLAFGAVLLGFGHVTGVATLVLGFTGLRLLGQGSLGLTASTAVALAFDRRRGTAVGLTTAIGSAGVSLAPVVLNQLIGGIGWRTTLVVEAIAVWMVVPALAQLALSRHPRLKVSRARHSGEPERSEGAADASAAAAGDAATSGDAAEAAEAAEAAGDPPSRATNATSWTARQAMRTPMFWAMAGALATVSMIGTGLNFHQISLLGAHGLTPTQAAAIFLPQTASVLLCTLVTGPLVDRLPPKLLMIAAMGALVTAMLLVTVAAPGWRSVVYGVALGSVMGSLRAQEAAIMPRFFGTGHLGSIRGILTSVGVGSSAFGPVVLALGQAGFGSYTPIIMVLLVFPAAVALAVLMSPTPEGGRP